MTVAEKQAWVNEQRDKIVGRFSGDKASREPLHTVSTTRISASSAICSNSFFHSW